MLLAFFKVDCDFCGQPSALANTGAQMTVEHFESINTLRLITAKIQYCWAYYH